MRKCISIFCAFLACCSLVGCGADSSSGGSSGNGGGSDSGQTLSYEVSFKVDGEIYESMTVEKNGKIIPPTEPSKASTPTITYQFKGWYYGEEEWDFENDIVATDMVLEAEWIEEEYTKEYLPSNP